MRNAKVDRNQPEIVKAFRSFGWAVLIISQLKNCADIIVSKDGRTIVIEIKDGEKPKSQQKLTEGELKFMDQWQGEYRIITCIDDVVSICDERGSRVSITVTNDDIETTKTTFLDIKGESVGSITANAKTVKHPVSSDIRLKTEASNE